jgi:hypothetical protein
MYVCMYVYLCVCIFICMCMYVYISSESHLQQKHDDDVEWCNPEKVK